MPAELQDLKFVRDADVYKGGILAGHLGRTGFGGVRFSYDAGYLADGGPDVAVSLPLSGAAVETSGGALPAFFAGLLPEGHRLTVLKNATKTSFDDELTLLLAVGADVPGDVQVVPAGERPVEPPTLADTSKPETLDFSLLVNTVDLHGLPGVQRKTSASMLTTPRAIKGRRYLLKLDPPEHPHLVENEALHLQGGRALKIPVAKCSVIDETLALPVSGKTRHLKSRHWVELADSLGLPGRAATAANRTALAAAAAIRLDDLPFAGSPLHGAQRELRFRRRELEG